MLSPEVMTMYDPVNDVYVSVAPLPGRVKGLIKAVPDGDQRGPV